MTVRLPMMGRLKAVADLGPYEINVGSVDFSLPAVLSWWPVWRAVVVRCGRMPTGWESAGASL